MSAFSGIRKWAMKKFAESLISDAQKGEYGMNVKQILDWLNGRKTAIGLLLAVLTQLQAQVPDLVKEFGADPSMVTHVGNALAAVVLIVGAAHKVIKGQ
jgi:hypothetical protein